MGLKVATWKWFKSYLSNRKQFITYCDKQRNIETIPCGVPQGSIVGPLSFLIFVNDKIFRPNYVCRRYKPVLFSQRYHNTFPNR